MHGIGLYLGVEMVRDPETLEPATRGDLGDLRPHARARGDHPAHRRPQNILKTKPPLCIDIEAADFYVDTLDRVLTEGW